MGKGLKVLIVDDEPRNLRILSEILADYYDIEQAEDGEEALQKVDEFLPDLILLDGMMPGKTGLDVCRQLRADSSYDGVRVIMVTGMASPAEQQQGLAVGADGYLAKPFREEELLAEINRVTH